MLETFEQTANNISEDCHSWMKQLEYYEPTSIERRKRRASSAYDFIRTVLGFLIKPKFENIKNIYIFEGIRNRDYMKAFRPESVVVIGSHAERSFAKLHGYKFCWSFPMVSAVHSKLFKGWHYFINRQIGFWKDELSKSNNVIVFLYEDTQPLGCYLVHIGRLLKSKVVTICIQHGYACNRNFELRCEGVLSDINFVWDNRQVSVIGCNIDKTFEIGLPYVAVAKPVTQLIVVLVGSGMYGGQYDEYEVYGRTLDLFIDIDTELRQSLGLEVFYRPHPNEWLYPRRIAELREKFPLLDSLDKVQRLNGPKAIFIGGMTSLLYEAGVAGHFVAFMKLHAKMTPEFDYDHAFGPADIPKLPKWISKIEVSQFVDSRWRVSGQFSPLERFAHALDSAKLVRQ